MTRVCGVLLGWPRMRQDFLTIYGEPNASVSKFVVPNGTNPTAEEDGESVLDEDLLLGVGRAGENWYWVSNGWMPASRLDRNSSRASCAGFRKLDQALIETRAVSMDIILNSLCRSSGLVSGQPSLPPPGGGWLRTSSMVRYTFASELFNTDDVPDILTISWSDNEDQACVDTDVQPYECPSALIDAAPYVARANMELVKHGPLL